MSSDDVSLQSGSLAEALLAFQADPPQVIKDSEAEVRSKDNRTRLYGYKYLSLQGLLSELRPRLTELGLLWRSKPGILDGKPVLFFSLEHVPSGEKDEGVMPMVLGATTMQGLGSSLSFARRYALITALNLAPDVDDDASLSTQESSAPRKLTKAEARELYEAAKRAGVLDRLQLAASHVLGSDVGECITETSAENALIKMDSGQAAQVAYWITKKQSETIDA